jgi:hypothetical protein
MIVMKFIKQLIFSSMLVIGLSLAVSAQRDDQKKPPKDPPVVTPGGPKKPKDNPPPRDSGGDKGRGGGKKPGFSTIISGSQIVLEQV